MKSRRQTAPEALLRMLGLAARAGAALPGTERVREAARSGGLEFALIATDASLNSRNKLLPLLDARRLPYAIAFDRRLLGAAVGKAPVSALGITDRKFASRVREMLSDPERASGADPQPR